MEVSEVVGAHLTSRPTPFRRRVLVNTASTVTANAWAIVLAVVTLPLLLRGLGPAAFGTWVLVQTFSAVNGWLSLADLGVGVAITRAISERAALEDGRGVVRLVVTAVVLYLVLGAACGLVLATAGRTVLPAVFRTPEALRPALRAAIALFGAQVLLDLLTQGAGACLEGLQRVDLSRGVDAARRTLVAGATAFAALAGGGLFGVAGASLAASAAGTIIGVIVLRRHLPHTQARPDIATAGSLLAYGSSVALLNGTGVLHRTMDRVIAGVVLGPAAVALVEIATSVQNGASAVLSASSYAAISSSSWLRARGDGRALEELLERGTKYSMLATCPVVAGAVLLSAPLVRVWVGQSFHHAAGLVVVAVLTTWVAAPLQVGSNLLQGVGRAPAVLGPAAVAVLVNLGTSVVLVQRSGIVGVFQGTLLGLAIVSFPLARAVLRETGTPVGRFVRVALAPSLPPTLALAVAVLLVLALPLSDGATLVAGTGTGLLAYATVACRWSVGSDERSELWKVLVARPG